MDLDKIKALIEVIPNLIIYMLPGFLIIATRNYMFTDILEKDNLFIFKSVIISYLLVNIEKSLYQGDLDINSSKFAVITSVFAIIIGFASVKIERSEYFRDILSRLGINKSCESNLFEEIIDYEYGMWFTIYIDNYKKSYLGKLRNVEYPEDHEKCFILLSNYKYCIYNENGEPIKVKSHLDTSRHWVTIRLKDINSIEMYYDEDSKKSVDI